MKAHQIFGRKTRMRIIALFAEVAAIAFFSAVFEVGTAPAAEINVMATTAVRGALRELAPQFERATGHPVIMDFASAIPLKRRIDAGATFDIVILTPALVGDLVKQGKVLADARTAFVRTGLGVGVAKGAPKPDISSVEALTRTLLTAKSVGYEPEAQPGIQFLEILDRLEIADNVRPKLKPFHQVDEMPKAVEAHEVEIVISSVAAMLTTTTIEVVGAFPPAVQRYIDFTVGISAASKEPEAAKSFLGFLLSPAATSVFKAKGFERD